LLTGECFAIAVSDLFFFTLQYQANALAWKNVSEMTGYVRVERKTLHVLTYSLRLSHPVISISSTKRRFHCTQTMFLTVYMLVCCLSSWIKWNVNKFR